MSPKTNLTEAEKARRAAIIELARSYEREGDLELDDAENVVISEGDDNGAYVQMWKWVEFSDTKLCKDKDHDSCTDNCPALLKEEAGEEENQEA